MRIQETPAPADNQIYIAGLSIPIIAVVDPGGCTYYAVLDCDGETGGAYEA